MPGADSGYWVFYSIGHIVAPLLVGLSTAVFGLTWRGAFVLLGGGVAFLRPLLVVHVLVDVLLVAYVGLLLNARQVYVERETKVHYLPGARRPAAAAGEPLLLLQRVGG